MIGRLQIPKQNPENRCRHEQHTTGTRVCVRACVCVCCEQIDSCVGTIWMQAGFGIRCTCGKSGGMQNNIAIIKTPQRRTTPVHILLSNPDHILNDLLLVSSFLCVCHRMSRDCTERVTRYGLKSGEKKTCNDVAQRDSSLEESVTRPQRRGSGAKRSHSLLEM